MRAGWLCRGMACWAWSYGACHAVSNAPGLSKRYPAPDSKPTLEMARSKMLGKEAENRAEAELTQTAPSAAEPKAPMPSLPALDDA